MDKPSWIDTVATELMRLQGRPALPLHSLERALDLWPTHGKLDPVSVAREEWSGSSGNE